MASDVIGRTLIIIPTYCEHEVIAASLMGIRHALPECDVLVVDDASPDGTAEVVLGLAANDGRVHLLARPRKDGLGRAYVAGFQWALERHYDVVVEMDADGSHRVEDLQSVLATIAEAELVIGSRWVPGGRTVGWPLRRRIISRAGNWYARWGLALPVHDATSGLRAFRADALRRCLPHAGAAHGYAFQVEMAWRVHRKGMRIVEVPITFKEREQGSSKMSIAIALEAAVLVPRWRLEDMLGR